jgi:hypothetical protein
VGFGGAAAIAFVTDDARNMNENYSFPASFCPPPPSLDSLHSRNLNLLTRLKKELKPLLVEVGATTSSIVYGSFFSAN